MKSSQILVTGLPDGTTKYDLIIYFQSERDSGGGDVIEVSEIEHGQATIIFSDAEAASRASSKAKHYFKGCEVKVFLLAVLEGTDLKKDSSKDDRPEVKHGAINNPLGIEHSNHKNKNTDASASPLSYDGTASNVPRNRKSALKQCTVKVKDLPADINEEMLLHYFENATRSKGGPVSQISDINRELQTCLITFENPDDAVRTVEHSPHRLGSFRLDLSLLETLEDNVPGAVEESKRKDSTGETEVIITVSGKCLPPEDDLRDYFENQRRSGGGKVLSIDYTDKGDAVVTFAEVKDLKRLLKPDSHSYDGHLITVARQPPVPLDPVRVYVQGLKAGVVIKLDNVRNYLEKFCDVYVTDVRFGCNNNALVVFDAEPDFAALYDNVSKDSTGLKGSKPELERVPLCTCIHVTGLMKETPEMTIELYFDNERRSGGRNVSGVERIGENEALVFFKDSASVDNVINHGKNHTIGNLALEVRPYYPFIENTVRNKSEITCDPDVLDYIKESHKSDYQVLMDENEIELFLDDTPIATVSSSAKKRVCYNAWQEKMGRLESFLQGFKKNEIHIPSEIFDEVASRWKKQTSMQGDVLVSFHGDRRLANIIGKSKHVEKEKNSLQELIHEITEDTELMKSITEVNKNDIPKSRLTLLQMSGICEKLENEHQHLRISFKENCQRLCLKGPRIVLQEAIPEVLGFTSKVVEQAVPLSTNKIKVLKKSTVLEYTHCLLKQRGVQALFVYDQSKTSNEVQVVGDCARSVEEATVVLQNAIQERSLHLTKENTVVLKGRRWNDFQSEVTSNFKVLIFTDSPFSTVCVSGIAEDVKECFEQVKQFLDANTILHDSLPLDEGTTRFIVQKWGSKLDDIKTALAYCFIEIKPTSNYDGIEVSGTTEGLEKCLPRIQELVEAVQTKSVPVDKPAMKKFILHVKGSEVLKSIEDSNQCVILVKEGKAGETSLTGAGAKEFSGMSSVEDISSYNIEDEGKSSSFVLDGADAIVNPFDTETAVFVEKEKPKIAKFDSRVTTHTVRMKKTLRSSPSIRITVKVGDLSKEKADILVGTAASSLNLEENPCAKALKVAAGPSLQHECTKKGSIRAGDIAVIDQTASFEWGLQCKTVIFAVCSSWNGGQGREVLKGLLTKCLEEADHKHMTSIAFGAIGTGNLQFPRDQVAEIYFDEVISYNQRHPKTSLKDVRFVVYDTLTIQAFQAVERAKQNNRPSAAVANGASFSPVRERIPDHLETTVNQLSFQVQQGSITDETTEAIAVISNNELNISASEAGAAILKEGGGAIAAECSRHAPQSSDSVFVSTAGTLKTGHLYHIVPKQSTLTPDNLRASVLKCLEEAEFRGLSSISFPAIGTGSLNMNAKDCTRAVLTAIRELSNQNPKSLKLVKMVIFQKSMIKDVRSVMAEVCGINTLEERGAVRKFFGKVARRLCKGSKEEKSTAPTTNWELDNRKVDLLIFAGCQSDLQRARGAVIGMMAENSIRQEITGNEAIKCLTEGDMRMIHTLELKHSVEVNVKKELGCIVVDGLSDDVCQVLGEIYEILRRVDERSHAKMISKDIQWKRKVRGSFKEYESHLNAEIEIAFHQNRPDVIIRRDGEKFKIVFDGSELTEHDDYGNITEVRRIDLRKDVRFPVEWAPQPLDPRTGREETVYVHQLDPSKDAQEYGRVRDLFRQSCTNNIIKIERIQNPTLYRTYAINKQDMDKARLLGSNEMCLFHGTKSAKCELINHKGFNRSFCGENAAYYGNGVYFAAQASYSAKSLYSPPDSNGYRHMYLARVLVGDYTEGNRGMITPPAKNSKNLTDTYDTVVNDVNNPTIYVVFYDWQCYPEYLITFQ